MEVSKDTALKIAMEAEHIIVLTAVIVAMVLCQDLVQVKMRNFSPF